MLTTEQSTCLHILLENGCNVPSQICIQEHSKAYISIVIQWTLPLQAQFLIIGRGERDNGTFSFWKTFMVPFQAQILHSYQIACKKTSINSQIHSWEKQTTESIK